MNIPDCCQVLFEFTVSSVSTVLFAFFTDSTGILKQNNKIISTSPQTKKPTYILSTTPCSKFFSFLCPFSAASDLEPFIFSDLFSSFLTFSSFYKNKQITKKTLITQKIAYLRLIITASLTPSAKHNSLYSLTASFPFFFFNFQFLLQFSL